MSDVRDRLASLAVDLVADLAMVKLLSNRNFDVADIASCDVRIFIVIRVLLSLYQRVTLRALFLFEDLQVLWEDSKVKNLSSVVKLLLLVLLGVFGLKL